MRKILKFDISTSEFEDAANGSEGSLHRMIEALHTMMDSVPDEHRNSVRFQISTEDDYYGSYSWINFDASWSREQTKEEEVAENEQAIAKSKAWRDQVQAQSYTQYVALKAVFDPPPKP